MNVAEEQYLQLKNRIYSHTDSKAFRIYEWRLKSIPPEIRLLHRLQKLSISKVPGLKGLPNEIAELPHLGVLSIEYCQLKKIPKILKKLVSLQYLSLSGNRFLKKNHWAVFENLSQLQILHLRNSLGNLISLPLPFCQLSQLKRLNLKDNRLRSLPDEFAQLTNLEALELGGNNFETFPTVITRLPKLRYLQIPASALRQLPDEVLLLQNIEEVEFTAVRNPKNAFIVTLKNLLRNSDKYGFTSSFQQLLLSLIRDAQIDTLSNQQLFDVLHSRMSNICNMALAELEKRIEANVFGTFRMPQADDHLITKGKFKSKVTDLKRRLHQQNIKTGRKATKQTDFILIGKEPQDIKKLLDQFAPLLITEQQLIQHLNQLEQPYLISTSPEESHIDNIRQLLASQEEDNTLLALEIIKAGGLPNELLTDLFLTYKFSSSSKVKRLVKRLVGQQASPDYLAALNSRKQIGRYLAEKTVCNNLVYYSQKANLKPLQLIKMVYERTKRGRLFALFHLDTTEKQSFFKHYLIKDHHLSLAGLGLTELPKDFCQLDAIHSLDLSLNKFKKVPSVLFKCTNLHTLNIRRVPALHQIPDMLWDIPNLKRLYVSTLYWEGPKGTSPIQEVEGVTVHFR